MLEVGTIAPDFEATLDDGTLFRLSDLRGKKNVVLYFYPAAFSGGCTRQACQFRDSYDAISDYDAVIIGVSKDTASKHTAFRERYNLGFPMIGATDGLLRNYDVKTFLGYRARITYVIDKSGVIRSAFRHDIAIGRHVDDVLAALSQIEARAA
jgi:peroxiredoxin Q/BCP